MIDDLLGTLSPHGVDLFPKLLAPVSELLHVLFDVSGAFAATHGVDFNCHLLGAYPSYNDPNAKLQKRFSIPLHAEFHDFGQSTISTKQGLMRYFRVTQSQYMARNIQD